MSAPSRSVAFLGEAIGGVSFSIRPTSAMDHLAQIIVSPAPRPPRRGFPPVVYCRGTKSLSCFPPVGWSPIATGNRGRPSHNIKGGGDSLSSARTIQAAFPADVQPLSSSSRSPARRRRAGTRGRLRPGRAGCASPFSRRGCASGARRSSTLGCSPNVLPTPRRTGIPEWTIREVVEDERRKLVDYSGPFDRFHAVPPRCRRPAPYVSMLGVVGRHVSPVERQKEDSSSYSALSFSNASMCEIRHTDAHVSCWRCTKCMIFPLLAQPLRWHVDCKVTVRSRGPDELFPSINQPRAWHDSAQTFRE